MAGRPFLGSTPTALKAVRWADRYGKSDAEAARKFGIGKSSVSRMRKKMAVKQNCKGEENMEHTEAACRFGDEYIEKQLRSVAAMRGDGNAEDSLAYQAAECISRLRIAASGGVVKLEDVPDTELPGMWERADFM